mmetsp:Transcript_31399/g.80134  ORF Transcript_31399/g.80134 Transcript_31399/m.80134 type:complete len:254 (+) Transcript_31399:305-1066(+)
MLSDYCSASHIRARLGTQSGQHTRPLSCDTSELIASLPNLFHHMLTCAKSIPPSTLPVPVYLSTTSHHRHCCPTGATAPCTQGPGAGPPQACARWPAAVQPLQTLLPDPPHPAHQPLAAWLLGRCRLLAPPTVLAAARPAARSHPLPRRPRSCSPRVPRCPLLVILRRPPRRLTRSLLQHQPGLGHRPQRLPGLTRASWRQPAPHPGPASCEDPRATPPSSPHHGLLLLLPPLPPPPPPLPPVPSARPPPLAT